jgi:hypothetical protein
MQCMCDWHYRRHAGFLDEAKKDLTTLLSLEASNTAARKELALVKEAIKAAKAKEKAAFGGMFGKVSIQLYPQLLLS